MPEDLAPGDGAAEEALVVDVGGFEGPLDLLLTLAQSQKVDLRRVSILALAEQYLAFVSEARRLRIELAADYLVMAAWLAFLKSRLLLPQPKGDAGPSGEELAARLAERLARLEAVRRAAALLMARDRLGSDVFARGMPETAPAAAPGGWTATLADLLRAYAAIRSRGAYAPLHLKRPAILTLEEAFARLSAALGGAVDWADLAAFLPADWRESPERRRTAAASTFVAALELAKRGAVELRQSAPFAPLYLRARVDG
jgi:segregation and condensation protein A